MNNCRALVSLSVLILLLVSGVNVGAQTNTGTIVGTVSDQTGAVIPGAKVRLTHEQLRVEVEVETNAVGDYVSPVLRAGPYEIRVEATGFRTAVHTGVLLHVNERLQVNFVLQPGAVAEVVDVTGAVPMLQTQAGDVGSVIEARTITDLPLDGRRYVDLMLLAPGALPAPGVRSNPREGRINVDGNFSLQNYFVMNGVDNNSFTQNAQDRSPQVARPAPDALREFRVQTRTYSAEFGWAQGAIVNAEIKSGSNDFHGAGWWFHRNDNLNATNFFANRAALKTPEELRNQYGFAVGGPMRRDQTFFFFDYEHMYARKETTAGGTVPTALFRAGDFSESPVGFREDAACALPPPRPPGTRCDLTNLRATVPEEEPCLVLDNASNPTQLLGLNLTANRMDGRVCGDPVGMALVQLYPLPTGPALFDFLGAPNIPLHQNSFDIRMDHRISNNDNIYGVYDYFDVDTVVERGPFPNPLATGGFSANSKVRGQLVSLTWVHTFSPAVVNDARGGFNRVFSISEPLAPQGDAGPDFGLTGLPGGPLAFGLPPIRIDGFSFLGTSEWRPQFSVSQVYQAIDNLSYLRGNHQMKFGFEFKRAINNFLDIRAPNGAIGIPNFWTNNGIANLLLGNVQSARTTSAVVPHNYIDGYMLYAQDSWRVTPQLTLNYGVRYEYFTPVIERDRLTSNFDPSANGGQGVLLTAFPGPLPATSVCTAFPSNQCLIRGPSGDSVFARTLVNPDRNNLAPRFSFAWNPMERVVLRGGFAIFYQVGDRIGSSAILQLNPPHFFETFDAVTSTQSPQFLLRDGYPPFISPTDIDTTRLDLRARSLNERSPYSQQWSFGPQIQLSSDLSLEIAYVGQVTHKVRKLRRLNQAMLVNSITASVLNPARDCAAGPAPPCRVFPFRDWTSEDAGRDGIPGTADDGLNVSRFSDFLGTDGNTNYHSLQVNARKRFSQGFTFNAAYTWGRAMGTVGDNLSTGTSASLTNPQNSHDLRADYGRLVFDQRQRFVVNWVWELPFGPGKAYLSEGRVAKILGDWQINGIVSSTSGVPIGIGASDRSNTFSQSPRANCLSDPSGPRSVDRFGQMFPGSPAFAQPASFTFGNCASSSLSSWPHHVWDVSLFKKIRIDEERRLEFRVEFFNLWNTPQFDNPNGFCGGAAGGPCTLAANPSFGRTTLVQDPERDARVIQFGLKFYF